jgi:HSP20 family protein
MLFDNDFFKSFESLGRQILGEFNGLDRGFRRMGHSGPGLNLYEEGEAYVVEMALPGFSPDSLDVNVEEDVLTISGERPAPEGAKDRKYGWAERGFGRFTRQIRLGRHVDRNGIRAEFEHGMLTITVPKAEEARPRKIPVSVK